MNPEALALLDEMNQSNRIKYDDYSALHDAISALIPEPPTDDEREALARGDWTDERIREGFIYDGGESDYLDPVHGAQTQRDVAGRIFDRWLVAHDAQVRAEALREAADKLASEVKSMGSSGDLFTDETWTNGAMHVVVRMRSEAALDAGAGR